MSDPRLHEALPLVRQYLPQLEIGAMEQLTHLGALVRDWNTRVNLISRKDIAELEEHHLLHSLALANVLKPADDARFVDLGTGGGFPGLPLAIVYPQCRFTLVDSIAKKGRAVEAIAAALSLRNVRVLNVRAESVRDRFDYVLGRAVAALPQFLAWAKPLLRPGDCGQPENGVLYFKGTHFRDELAGTGLQPDVIWKLEEMFPDRSFFADKFLLHFKAPIAR